MVLAIVIVLTLLPAAVFADSQDMHASEDIIKAIKKSEGFRPTPYIAVAGESNFTIGYGHHGSSVTEDMEISEAEAAELLKTDLARFEKYINNFFKKHHLSYSQQVFDALLSLTYNTGPEWLNNGNYLIRTYLINGIEKYDELEIVNSLAVISGSGGIFYQSLVKRRIREARIMLYGDYTGKDSPDYTYIILHEKGGTLNDGNHVVVYPKGLPYGKLPGAYKEGYVLRSWVDSKGHDISASDIASEGLEVKADWEEGEAEKFSLSVDGGSGSGKYAEGETVSLIPGSASDGEFLVWRSSGIRIITDDGGYKFKMPAYDLSITSLRDYSCEGKFCPSEGFSDIGPRYWAHDAIDFVYENDLFKGFSDTIFNPNAKMSRGMLLEVLYRLSGSPSVNGYENPFSDVWESNPYHDAILWAYRNHIASGYADGTFSPNSALKREHIAVFLMRYAILMGYYNGESEDSDKTDKADELEKFSDAENISDYAEGAVCWAVRSGIINGMNSTSLDPQDGATRAQVAVMVTRFVRNVAASAVVEKLI